MPPDTTVRIGQVWRSKRGGPRFRIIDAQWEHIVVENVRGHRNERCIKLDRLHQGYTLIKDAPEPF